MTRMLFWNVDNVSATRFNTTDTGHDLFSGKSKQDAAVDRLKLLCNVITATTPDIVIIIEVLASLNKVSDLAGNNPGGIGVLVKVLDWLRNTAPDNVKSPKWRLVPPMQLVFGVNNAETLGIFYRGETGAVTRFFTGPNIWPGGLNAHSTAPRPLVSNGPYGDAPGLLYSRFLRPPGSDPRTVPDGALHNEKQPEPNLAARLAVGAIAPAEGSVDFGVNRPPYMATFTEQTDAGLRNLTVFGIHGPTKDAAAYIDKLSTVAEIASPLGAGETRVIGGDFNHNLLDVDGNLGNAYNPLTGINYQLLLRPEGAAPPILDAYRGYFCTKLQSIPVPAEPATKFLWSDGVNLSYYPGYNYLAIRINTYSVDNVLVKPYVDARDYQTTSLNTVVSSPLNAIVDPAGNPPKGSLQIDSEMPNVPDAWNPWPKAPTVPTYDLTAASQLLAWERYGHIVSTSDHFALFVDV